MIDTALMIGKTSKGKYKLYLWGSASGHISDWRGCNYRFAPVDGQPFRGFETQDEAEAFAHEKFQTREQVEEAGRRRSGQHLNDDKFAILEFKSIYTKDTVIYTK